MVTMIDQKYLRLRELLKPGIYAPRSVLGTQIPNRIGPEFYAPVGGLQGPMIISDQLELNGAWIPG